MSKRNVTITEIARAAKLSISTVSKAFSNSTDISEVTKAAVLKTAVEMGYSVKRTQNPNGTLAAIVEGLDHTDTNSFEYQLLFGFKLAASAKGYDTVIIQTHGNDWSFKEYVEKAGYAGAFISRITYSKALTAELIDTKTPTITFDNIIQNQNTAYVGCDNNYGISCAVKHLVELGHKKIAYYGGNPMLMVSLERKNAFIKAVREQNLNLYPEIIFESDFAQNYSDILVPKIIDFGATAIVCASDLLAKFVISELKKNSIKVPQQMSVIGFDNVPLCEEITPKLTTINQGNVEIGKNAYYLLSMLIQGISVSSMQFRPKLIQRESTTFCPINLDR